jgi:hypothetical protein
MLQIARVHVVENIIKDRLQRGGHIGFSKLMDEIGAMGHNRASVSA